MKKLIAVGLVLVAVVSICLMSIICFPRFAEIFSNQRLRKFSLYCEVYPYSYNIMNPLNRTDFEIQLERVKEIGFDGILLGNVECFYDDGQLQWAVDETKKLGLDVIIPIFYFNRSYHFPFPPETWEVEGFRTNQNELNLYCEYVTNVSLIVRSYINFKGYIVYYPFNSSTYDTYKAWRDYVGTPEYKWKLMQILNAIREVDGHPIYLGVQGWSPYPKDVYDRLPKDMICHAGFAYQPYNIIKDDIETSRIKEFYDYWKKFGVVQIGEFGYATHNDLYIHGLASTEQRKASMVIEFLDYVKRLGHDGFVCYFGLTDFPPENADFGLVYGNYTLKLSGIKLKEWIKQNEMQK